MGFFAPKIIFLSKGCLHPGWIKNVNKNIIVQFSTTTTAQKTVQIYCRVVHIWHFVLWNQYKYYFCLLSCCCCVFWHNLLKTKVNSGGRLKVRWSRVGEGNCQRRTNVCVFQILEKKRAWDSMQFLIKHNDSKSSLLQLEAGKHIISGLFASTFVYF